MVPVSVAASIALAGIEMMRLEGVFDEARTLGACDP